MTRTRVPRQRPDRVAIRADAPSYVAALTDAETFGWHIWADAYRRGLSTATAVVVPGDEAHWIQGIAETHFPQAPQIVNWYHASQYVWNAATARYGEGTARHTAWVQQQWDALWDGHVDRGLVALQPHAGRKDAVDAAISYSTTHRARIDYPAYRARGLHIGSGTVESGCKQLVSARLKRAGMSWNTERAEAVAVAVTA